MTNGGATASSFPGEALPARLRVMAHPLNAHARLSLQLPADGNKHDYSGIRRTPPLSALLANAA